MRLDEMKRRHLVVIANEEYGNTDWVYLTNEAKLKGIRTTFIGRGSKEGKKFYPDIIVTAKNRCELLKKSISTIKIQSEQNNECIFIIRFFHLAAILALYVTFFQRKYRKYVCLDVRTSSVHPNKIKRYLSNFILKSTSRLFSKTYIISKLVAARIGIRHYEVLPFGFDRVAEIKKEVVNQDIQYFKFIYVGTINRPGLKEFFAQLILVCKKKKIGIEIDVYTENSESYLLQKFEDLSCVFLCGKLSRDNFKSVVPKYHIGLSPLPDNDIYDHQPHTKLFEYIECGIPYITKRTPGVIDQMGGEKFGWHYENLEISLDKIISDAASNYSSRLSVIKSFKAPSWSSIFEKIEELYENNYCR